MKSGLRIAVITAIVGSTFFKAVFAQTLDKTFLNSTVLIKYHKDATHDSVGTGFLLLHPIATTSNGMTTYRVLLITNKHALHPEHGPKEMSVRIAVRSEIGEVEVKDVILPILGTDGKYLRSVALHPNPGVDVAAIDCGADLSRQHANLFREISETHRALTTDLLISDRDFEEASIGIGTQIYLLGYPSGMYDPRNAIADPQDWNYFNGAEQGFLLQSGVTSQVWITVNHSWFPD